MRIGALAQMTPWSPDRGRLSFDLVR